MSELTHPLGMMKRTLPHDAPLTGFPGPAPASQSFVVPGMDFTMGYVGPPTFETSETLTSPLAGSSQLTVTWSPLAQVTTH